MDHTALGEALTFARATSTQAADVLGRAPRPSAASPGGITTKLSATDIATTTDVAIEEAIIDAIRHRFPDDAILAEESAGVGFRANDDAFENGRRWIIDPLDGTSNFVRGLRSSAVSIALEVDGEIVVGVVADPYENAQFWAAAGRGAYRNVEPLTARPPVSALAEAFISVGGSNRVGWVDERAALVAALIPQADSVRDNGSTALSLCYVADGRFDAHIVFNVQPWDVAAGFVIAREAGCLVTAFDGTGAASHERALVTRPELASQLIDLLGPVL